MRYNLLILLCTCLFSCKSKQRPNDSLNTTIPADLKSYWFNGKAEISSYNLEQARYGEIRKGTAIAIFVTEDFSKKHQVKLDNPQNAGDDPIPILKFNLTKNFVTGIYPYSMMLSVFKPFNSEVIKHPVKLTASSQEWCGQTFTQLNQHEPNYDVRLFSYFEKESDKDTLLPIIWLEDELWTQIRLNPSLLPINDFKIVPGFLQQRLLHCRIGSFDASGRRFDLVDSISWLKTSKNVSVYEVEIKELGRNLKIFYTTHFPNSIIAWEEIYMDGFGEHKKRLTTRATLLKTINIDYWNYNKATDTLIRKELLIGN